jgi:glycosyltransferase involved in cell wall biosynthesis
MLIIAAYPAYKGVPTAGGMTHFFYLEKLSKVYNVRLITFADGEEIGKVKSNAEELGIQVDILDKKESFGRRLIDLESHFDPFNRNGRFVPNSMIVDLNNILLKLKHENYSPDIILMEWTEILLACRNIKKVFSKSIVVASEHDVTFLSKERKFKSDHGVKKIVRWLDYLIIRNAELRCLRKVDLIITHNDKDKKLLCDYKIDNNKIHSIVPYYKKINASIKYDETSKNILFFGAMARPENYKSAKWFIQNVMNELDEFVFIIAGNNPPKELLNMNSKNVIVTGFIEDVTPYFENALCFVAPLVLGAGIKVKVLEALSSGLPVLTNEIGIEGISAEDKKEYIFCSGRNEYIEQIRRLYKDFQYREYIGKNGRRFVSSKFDLDISWRNYMAVLNNQVQG